MPEKITDAIKKVRAYWKSIDSKVRKRVVLISIVLLISLAVCTVALNTTEYTVLYSGLDLKESGEIISILNELNVKSKNSSGGTILVDSNEEDNIRMQLAVQGYPKSGLNYDLYLNSINSTTSTYDKNVMIIYQLQDRLSSTIKMLDGISDAIVTISMETDKSFKFGNEITPVSANVILQLQNNFHPTREQIRAIQRLMITSVSGLNEENVVIIDFNLNDLLPESGSDQYSQMANNQLLLKQEVERQLTDKILFLFDPVFSSKNIKVAVNASVNLDRKTTEVIEYSPVINDAGIPYSVDELSEKFSDSTTNNNVGSDSLNDRIQKVINYRVNELKQTIEESQGSIEDITISILINNNDMDESSLENVKKIAAAAVGVETSKINVSNMNFTAHAEIEKKIEEALNAANENNKSLLSWKLIIGFIATIVFTALSFVILRMIKVRKMSNNETDVKTVITGTDQDASGAEALALSIQKNSLMEKFQNNEEERIIMEEIEELIKANPKTIANVITYWLELDDSKNRMIVEESKK